MKHIPSAEWKGVTAVLRGMVNTGALWQLASSCAEGVAVSKARPWSQPQEQQRARWSISHHHPLQLSVLMLQSLSHALKGMQSRKTFSALHQGYPHLSETEKQTLT